MDRLIAHPYSYRSKDFIVTYREDIGIMKMSQNIIKPMKRDDGRSYVTIYGKKIAPFSNAVKGTKVIVNLFYRMQSEDR